MENKKSTIEEKIKNRTNWFLLILLAVVVLFALIVAAVKILDVQILIKNFDFTALLSVIIAFFAIGLSVAFYNMASKSSDKFYSDIFGFIKSISESIGRMDEKFGEKLRSLDVGYNTVIQSGLLFGNNNELQDKIQKQKQEYDRLIGEKDETINKLIESSELKEKDKQKYKTEINKFNKKLSDLSEFIEKLEETNAYSKTEYITVVNDGNRRAYKLENIMLILQKRTEIQIATVRDNQVIKVNCKSLEIVHDKKRVASNDLRVIQEYLPFGYIRISMSTIMNVKYISKLEKRNGKNVIELIDETELFVLDSIYESVLNLYNISKIQPGN